MLNLATDICKLVSCNMLQATHLAKSVLIGAYRLLQDISDCWSPDGWLPVAQGSRGCTPQLVQGFNHDARQRLSRKRSSCSVQSTTAGNNITQPAVGVSQQSAAKQPAVNTSAPASSTVDAVKHVATGVTAGVMCRDLHSAAYGGNVANFEAAAGARAAALSLDSIEAAAEADPVYASPEATAAKAGSAHDSPEAAFAEANLAHDNRDAAAGEAHAATMAAWLIQKPSLLQGVLGCLESFAASTAGKSSVLPPPSNPPAGLLASSTATDKLSVVSACDTLLVL